MFVSVEIGTNSMFCICGIRKKGFTGEGKVLQYHLQSLESPLQEFNISHMYHFQIDLLTHKSSENAE